MMNQDPLTQDLSPEDLEIIQNLEMLEKLDLLEEWENIAESDEGEGTDSSPQGSGGRES